MNKMKMKAMMKQGGPQLNSGVTPDQLRGMVCRSCGQNKFAQKFILYYASPLQCNVSKGMVVNVPAGFVCMQCGLEDNIVAEDVYLKERDQRLKQEEADKN